MTMTVRRMIELLEDAASEYGDDATVMIQYQPGYPLKAQVAGVTTAHDVETRNAEDMLATYGEDYRTDEIEWPDPAPRVYVLATETAGYNENPYGDRVAWQIANY